MVGKHQWRNQLRREPRYSCHDKRLVYKKSWVRIPAPDSGWTDIFSHLLVKNTLVVWKEWKVKRCRRNVIRLKIVVGGGGTIDVAPKLLRDVDTAGREKELVIFYWGRFERLQLSKQASESWFEALNLKHEITCEGSSPHSPHTILFWFDSSKKGVKKRLFEVCFVLLHLR